MSDPGPTTFRSKSGSSTQEFIKKARLRRYPKTFRELLSRKMDDYFEYMTEGEFIRALQNFYLALKYIEMDKQDRLFIENADTKKVNLEKKAEFERLALKFEKLYGTKPQDLVCSSCGYVVEGDTNDEKMATAKEHAQKTGHTHLEQPISFLELRTRAFPDAATGKVSIARFVSFEQVWGKYLPQLVYLKAGYYVEDVIEKPDGWTSTVKEALVVPGDPLLSRYRTNWIPYAFWEEQVRRLETELIDVVVQLEVAPREYLHREQEREQREKGAAAIDDEDDDNGGSDDDDNGGGDGSIASSEIEIVDAEMVSALG